MNKAVFLDRDGVINYEKHKDYIHSWDEFRFYEDAKEAIAILAKEINIEPNVLNAIWDESALSHMKNTVKLQVAEDF